ncbi:hypothetical protein ACTQ4K_07590, partial [Clostridium sporogenes]
KNSPIIVKIIQYIAMLPHNKLKRYKTPCICMGFLNNLASYFLRSKCLASILQKQYEVYSDVFQYKYIKNPCIHTYITLDEKINRERLIDRLKKKSIMVATEDGHYLSTFKREKILKLNATNVREDYIEKGILDIIQELVKIYK